MTPADFIERALAAAIASAHVWPEYAVCEAALESAWGESQLCRRANNLFGQKQGVLTTGYPALELPTHEVVDGVAVPTSAQWVVFPDWRTSFAERMKLLQRARSVQGLRYVEALGAQDGESFVRLVSKVWATDPLRADKVLRIHARHFPAVIADPEVRA